MNFRDLAQEIDIARLEKEGRAEWEKSNRAHRTLERRVIAAVPLAMVIMAFAFYLISAPHTAHMIDLITPGWGIVAPIGFEFGIIIISALREGSKEKSWASAIIQLVLIGMSMIINVIGGFMAVVNVGSATSIAGMTINQLIDQYGSIPAAYQAALFLVVPVGIVIPFLASMVGEKIVKLSMGRISLTTESDEQRWLKASRSIMYNAIVQEALRKGAAPKTAQNYADYSVKSMYPLADAVAAPDALDLPLVDSQPVRAHMGFIAPADAPDARTRVRTYLEANPEHIHTPSRELVAVIGVGKTTIAEVQKTMRQTS